MYFDSVFSQSSKYCHGENHHGFFYAEGVKGTNRIPQRTKCISSRVEGCVRSKSAGNQVSADLIASNCACHFINFSPKKPIDRSIAPTRGDAAAFSRRKAVNFSPCHFALKRTRGAISAIHQISYRRTSVRCGHTSASIAPRDKYVWAWSRSIHEQIASKDDQSRCDAMRRCASRNLRHNEAIWTVTCRCWLLFGPLRCTWPHQHATVFHRRAFVKDKHLRAELHAYLNEQPRVRLYVRASEGETRCHSCATNWFQREVHVFLSIGLICRVAFVSNFFSRPLRSLAREFIASCKRTRNIRVFTLM